MVRGLNEELALLDSICELRLELAHSFPFGCSFPQWRRRLYIWDAGWNLAAWGSFESAAGPYMHDLVPRFYAHYTPGVPLLFAGYATVFPRNAYAGTIFNLLLGLSIAAIAFWWVLRQPAGRLRNAVAWAVALLAPAFIAYDRPETAAG